MGEDAEVRMIERAQNARCLLISRQVEVAVDGAHHKVQAAQHRIGQVQ